jgi:hypothetical protein
VQAPTWAIFHAIRRFGIQKPWAIEFIAANIEIGQWREYAIHFAGVDQINDPRIVKALQSAVEEGVSAPEVARAASLALAAIRGEQSYADGLVREFRTGDDAVKAWALSHVSSFDFSRQPASPDLVAMVEEGLRHDNPNVFDSAVRAAPQFDDAEERFAPIVARQRWSLSPRIRERARRAMRELEVWGGWDF